MKVFLSGSNTASEGILLLAEALRADGAEVTVPDHMQYGTAWFEEILSAIRRCDVFVAVIDEPKSSVMFELGYAVAGATAILLLSTGNRQLPHDLAAFPVLVVDRFDSRGICDAVAWIKHAKVKLRKSTADSANAQEMLRRIASDDTYLDELEPRRFEECVAQVFREAGFKIEETAQRGDAAFDIALRDFAPGIVAVVAAKKRNRNSLLSVTEVQRLVADALAADAQLAIIVTSGGITDSAKHFAAKSPIPVSLLSIDDLVGLSREGIVGRCT